MESMDSLSYSSLNNFGQCALQWKRLRDIGTREANYNEKSARGTIIHRFMEELINDYFLRGKWMKEPDAVDLMHTIWYDGFPTKEDDTLNIVDAVNWNAEFLEKSIADSKLLVAQVYKEVLPFIKPLEVEAYKTLDLPSPGGSIKKLHGVIDVISDGASLIDWKTSTSIKRADMLGYDLQATVYAALRNLPRMDVHFVQFIYLKRDAPRIEWATTKRDQRHTDWLLNEFIPPIIRQIEAGIYPATVGWHCKFCPVPCGVDPDLGVDYG